MSPKPCKDPPSPFRCLPGHGKAGGRLSSSLLRRAAAPEAEVACAGQQAGPGASDGQGRIVSRIYSRRRSRRRANLITIAGESGEFREDEEEGAMTRHARACVLCLSLE